MDCIAISLLFCKWTGGGDCNRSVGRESVRLLFDAIWDMAVERKYPVSETAEREQGAAHFLVHAIEHP